MMPKKYLEKVGAAEVRKKPIGSGPWKFVKSVPGDRIEMLDNRLVINDAQMPYHITARDRGHIDAEEDLFGIVHDIRVDATTWSPHAHFAPIDVPAGYYLVLGDNRDHSADSRVIGLVPRDEIVGRSRHIVMSLNYDNFYLPRQDRFLRPL